MHARSLLFVPGNRPERFVKACDSGADFVVIDLEDAVGPADKDRARKDTLAWIKSEGRPNVGVRINGLDTTEAKADIEALQALGLTMPFVMVPKINRLSEIEFLADALPPACGAIAPVLESGEAIINASAIFSHQRLTLCLFGGVDFSADIGSTLDWDALLYARSHLAACAAMHNVLVFDVPYLDVRDSEGCEEETLRVKALGIPARSAIHPAQIAPIHAVYTPSDEDILQAQRLVDAFNNANGNVALLDGKLIEMPLFKKASRVLAIANIKKD